jgi:hypothetical protein
LQESDALIRNQFRTSDEINNRVYYFKQAVLSAKTAKQLQDAVRKRKASHEQFRTMTLFDLMEDQGAIVAYLPVDDRIKLAQQTNNAGPIQIMAADAEINDIDDDTFKDLKNRVTESVATKCQVYISQIVP